MNRPLSLKHTVQPFSVPTEQKTTVLPTQSQRKLWEAVQRLKLESCSVMGVTEEGRFSTRRWFFSSSRSIASALSAAHQLQLVELPEIEGRMVPFGEGLDPNQDIWNTKHTSHQVRLRWNNAKLQASLSHSSRQKHNEFTSVNGHTREPKTIRKNIHTAANDVSSQRRTMIEIKRE